VSCSYNYKPSIKRLLMLMHNCTDTPSFKQKQQDTALHCMQTHMQLESGDKPWMVWIQEDTIQPTATP